MVNGIADSDVFADAHATTAHSKGSGGNETFLIAGTGSGALLGRRLATLLRQSWDANVVLLNDQHDDATAVDASSLGGPLREAIKSLPDILQRAEADHPAVSLSDFGTLEQDLALLCASLLWGELNKALPIPLTQVNSRESLARMLSISAEQTLFLQFVLSCMEDEGWLCVNGDGLQWKSAAEVDARRAEVSATALADRYPAFSGLVELIEHCANHLVSVMQGRQHPVQVLFPDGSNAFMEQKGRRIQDYSNLQQLRFALLAFIGRIADERCGKPLRILEVGGGTGILAKTLARNLKGKNVEYVFTDIGRTFLLDAQKFARENDVEFMSFRKLDISRDPAEQGFELGTYDLVLALDVVHATADIKRSATHIRSLLVPGGALCLLELVKNHPWSHLVFGLLPGWWTFTDTSLRTRSPLLNSHTWDSVLHDAGFEDVTLLPDGEPQGAQAEEILAIAVTPNAVQRDDRVMVMQVNASTDAEFQQALEIAKSQFDNVGGALPVAGIPNR